jgi:demethylmenaquinone methyltransferase / 2-methoxy-6-polyprenyl-1,4-benzoquinol methylase
MTTLRETSPSGLATTHDDAAKLALIRDVGFSRYFSASRWRDYNRQFFDGLAEKYDATNDLHSFGTKRRFDRIAVERLPVRPASRILDLCTGTGDIAILLAERHPDLSVTAVDASPRMLEVARRKAARLLDRIEFREGDALALDFPDGHFDGAVISFGLRNLESLEGGLRELRRVVRPGGFVSNIDQGKPRNTLFRVAYELHFKRIAPILGKIVFHIGEFNSFRYLPESNRYFPDQDRLLRMFESLGYRDVVNHDYWFGAVAQQVAFVANPSGAFD